jgi:type IV secretory pathway TraG/TraD family ATPase VirD4
VLARSTHPAHPGYLTLGPRDATQHLHVIAPTGAGKSTLLANLALQDIAAGRSVTVVEPKGDLIADLLDRIPADRQGDVVLLDPTDTNHPLGLNVLAGRDQELVVDQLVGVLHALYAAHWGPRTQDILHAGLLTLALAGGYTFIDLPVLLTDPSLRRRLVPKVQTHPALGPFWAWFEALSDGDRLTATGPVMNKVRSFTLRGATRNLLGQAAPTFDMSRSFARRQLLLVNLAKGRLGPETSQLLGALVLAQLWQAILGRGAIEPAKRHPAMVYVDEFQDYVRLPTDLGDALAQARGLGVGLTLAHQHLAQLGPDMRSAVLSNARSRVVFQSGDDAPTLDQGPRRRTRR